MSPHQVAAGAPLHVAIVAVLVGAWLGAVATPCSAAPDTDRDRDGLSDAQELHKYFTDPAARDSDGDGVPDGADDERREYTYSVRTRVRVLRPVTDVELLNDDYQDARVVESTDEYVELEVTHYPLNTWAEAIGEDAKWRSKASRMKEFTAPGVTANWDSDVRRTLLAELKQRGDDTRKMTDRELATKASAWLVERAPRREMFCTYYVDFSTKKPRVLPGVEAAFERGKGDAKWSVAEQLDHELFGRSMFRSRVRGACTSSSIYLTTGLRALGLPTRTIIAIPVADASDPSQRELVANGLTHHEVRRTTLLGLDKIAGSFASHTFNEVFVDGRWRRLNYAKLGQNILDANYMGLMTHVRTFRDISEAGLAPTWGRRYALGERSEAFPAVNPYRALEISDLFGEHAQIENPEVRAPEPLRVTAASWWQERAEELPSSWIDPTDGRGYVVLSLAERKTSIRDGLLLAAKSMELRADGEPAVRAKVTNNFWHGGREVLVLIHADQLAKMKPGQAYSIHAPAPADGAAWEIAETVKIGLRDTAPAGKGDSE